MKDKTKKKKINIKLPLTVTVGHHNSKSVDHHEQGSGHKPHL